MTVRPARSQDADPPWGSEGGRLPGPWAANARRRATRGKSFRTVRAVHVRAEIRMPDATRRARLVTRRVAAKRRATGPSRPRAGATAPVRPTITADVLRNALT